MFAQKPNPSPPPTPESNGIEIKIKLSEAVVIKLIALTVAASMGTGGYLAYSQSVFSSPKNSGNAEIEVLVQD